MLLSIFYEQLNDDDDMLYQFSQSFHHMKTLYVPMMDLYLIFQLVKGRCDGNQIILA